MDHKYQSRPLHWTRRAAILASEDLRAVARQESRGLQWRRPARSPWPRGADIENHRSHILVVEDDLANRVLLTRLLERAGYAVRTETDGPAALRAATDGAPDAVLLDIGLPGMDGLEVTRRLRDQAHTLTLPIILLTGRTSVEDVVAGLDAGANDFLGKPYHEAELLARIRSALRLRWAMAEMEAAHGVVAALANAVEAKDVTTEHHCQRLAGLAHRLATAIDLDGRELKGVIFGALLHDVGKIGVPEAILTKPGPLTDAEWVEMRRHPEIGEAICRPLSSSPLFAPIVRHHHERWDGTGYPDRLAGLEIPIGARIVGLVDAFDAMTHDRPYRSSLRLEQAVDELRRQSGRQFDPGLVEPFITLIQGDTSIIAERELRTSAMAALSTV